MPQVGLGLHPKAELYRSHPLARKGSKQVSETAEGPEMGKLSSMGTLGDHRIHMSKIAIDGTWCSPVGAQSCELSVRYH